MGGVRRRNPGEGTKLKKKTARNRERGDGRAEDTGRMERLRIEMPRQVWAARKQEGK